MCILYCSLLCLGCATSHRSERTLPSSSDWKRVFHVSGSGIQGTAFAILHNDREYLITARHVARGLTANTIAIDTGHGWATVGISKSIQGHGDADAAALGLDRRVMGDADVAPLCEDTDSIDIGTEVWILGFPLAMKDTTAGFGPPDALISHGYIAGQQSDNIILLDYHANHASSGSPVFARNRRGQLKIIGVLTGFLPTAVEGASSQGLQYNSGIATAQRLRGLTKKLDEQPFGHQHH